MKKTLASIVTCIATTQACAAPLVFDSGERQLQLIELYTSEGCSSCPPADTWLSSLVRNPDLWTRYIPIAFHVDYWNKLGWHDPYSANAYSVRQQLLRRQGSISAVYTPGFVVAGKEWRSWFGRRQIPEQPEAKPGSLRLTIDGARYIASLDSGYDYGELKLNIALLGMGIRNAIARGENAGKVLKHDFVTLSLTTAVSQTASWQGTLPEVTIDTPQAVAAWVSSGDSLQPIQAVGGFLTGNEVTGF